MSGSVAVTVTTVIHPSGSLASAPKNSSFLDNKPQAGLVLTVAILSGLALFGFLGFRFYRTVKKMQEIREVEAAARSRRYRSRIDDGDEDDSPYGSSGMTEAVGAEALGSRFDLLRTGPVSLESEDSGSGNTSEMLRRRVPSLDGLDTRSSLSLRSTSPHPHLYPVAELSADPRTHAPSPSNVSDTTGQSHTRSETQHSVNRLLTSAPSLSSSKSLHLYPYIALDPLPPPISLPDSFGEDEPSRPTTPIRSSLEDDEDYHATIGRVLKVANE